MHCDIKIPVLEKLHVDDRAVPTDPARIILNNKGLAASGIFSADFTYGRLAVGIAILIGIFSCVRVVIAIALRTRRHHP